MNKIALIAIGAIIALACIVGIFAQPLSTSPDTMQWYVYGAAVGCIIAGCGIYDLKSDDK